MMSARRSQLSKKYEEQRLRLKRSNKMKRTIFPDLVVDAVHPGKIDEQSSVEEPEIHYKAVKYLELIPLIIQGMKEQQKLIKDLQQERALLKKR